MPTPSTRPVDKRAFFESVNGWIITIARKAADYYRLDEDDCYQIAALQVWRVADRYDPSIAKPTTWVRRIAWSAIARYAFVTRRERSTVPGFDDAFACGAFDPAAAEETDRVRPDELRKLAAALQELPPHHRRTLEDYFGLGGRTAKNCRTLGGERGVTQAAVSAVKLAAIRRLRERLGSGSTDGR